MKSLLRLGNKDPLIGIMTSRKGEHQLVGNIPLFRAIQTKLLEIGGVSVVFSPEHVTEHGIKGVMYHPSKEIWEYVFTPLPQLVYNRIPFRKHENSKLFKQAKSLFTKKGIPFFNPGFLNKYDLFHILNTHSELKKYLIPTIMIKEKNNLEEFLKVHHFLYIKKSSSSMGKGIHTIKQLSDGRILYEDRSGKTFFNHFQDYWTRWKDRFISKEYIGQKAISPLLYNGRRFDFRILSVYDGKKHVPVGIGIRQAGQQQLTTHIPTGGNILPYSLFQTNERNLIIKEIVAFCGEELSKQIGLFAEFSIDMGLTKDEEYIIYEINSKPMSFDEKDIEENRVNKLCELFLKLR